MGAGRTLAKLRAYVPADEEKELHTWWTTIYARWTPVGAKLAEMKKCVVSGRRPSAAKIERERLRAERATHEGVAMLVEKINEMTKEWRAEEIERVIQHLRGVADQYSNEKVSGESPIEFWQRSLKCQSVNGAYPRGMTREESDRYDRCRLAASENARITSACIADPECPRKQGELHAEEIIVQFTAKMIEKLGFALPTLELIESGDIQRANGTLNCVLRVRLTTTASFTVRNGIVCSYSVTGLRFYRYPSTFHDVSVPGCAGSIAMVSEEEMNALFGSRDTSTGWNEEIAARLSAGARARLK